MGTPPRDKALQRLNELKSELNGRSDAFKVGYLLSFVERLLKEIDDINYDAWQTMMGEDL